MKLLFSTLATAGALSLVLMGGAPAKAQLIYDNGPLDGHDDARTINFGYTVTDEFTLSNPANLTEAQIGLWLFPGDTATSVDWSIGTSAFGSDIGSGTGALTNTFQYTDNFGYNIYESTFALSESLGAGTYWLSLQNLVIPSGNPGYWDQIGPDGTSTTAQQSSVGSITPESFQLYASNSAVPEPGTYAMIGSLGLTGAALLRRKRAR